MTLVRITSVPRTHYLVARNRYESYYDSRLTIEGRRFFLEKCSPEANLAYTSTSNGQLVGYFLVRYDIELRTLDACGTWVHPDFRGCHIAQRLWERALRTLDPVEIEVTTISKGGKGLVMKLEKRWKHIKWIR